MPDYAHLAREILFHDGSSCILINLFVFDPKSPTHFKRPAAD